MKKQTYLSLLIGLFVFGSLAQTQAQYTPRFIFEKDHRNHFTYSRYSCIISSFVNNTHYETYIEGAMANPFYAKQTVKTPGKPAITRLLNNDELKLLPSLGTMVSAKVLRKNPLTTEVSSWSVMPSGLITKAKNTSDQVKFLDFKVTEVRIIPFSRKDYRALESLQKNWLKKRKQWNNTYTFVIRQDSVYFKENKAYGIRKVVKVKEGKVVDIQAFKVVQNWLGRNKNKKVYEEKALELSQEELNATSNLDHFFSLSLAIIKQKYNTSFYKKDKGVTFEINQFFRDNRIKTYVLEKVSVG
ncbi:hypothetical protein BKI52_42955 [marine bacterium AO1-C]|nr:hypothetical protein BKI52_42955 [marine bacterium AO1-C]